MKEVLSYVVIIRTNTDKELSKSSCAADRLIRMLDAAAVGFFLFVGMLKCACA